MTTNLEVAVIADDLTGAADTGVQFVATGTPIYLIPVESLQPRRPWLAAANCISIYTATRQLSPEESTKRLGSVTDALAELRPRWIYKKIDSCLRGNVGAEIDVLLDALGFDTALVAPALPAQGRTTIGGIHRVHGRPLAETEFAKDPVTPVARSSVAEILTAQTMHPVGRVDLSEYGDPGRLEHAVRRERNRGCRLIACDAAEQRHLDRIAELVAGEAGILLPVGSAGLATSLAGRLVGGGEEPASVSSDATVGSSPFGHAPCNEQSSRERRHSEGGCAIRSERRHQDVRPPAKAAGAVSGPPLGPDFERLLLVCGTGSQVTRSQIDALLKRYPGVRHNPDPKWLLDATAEAARHRASRLLESWTESTLALGVRSPSPRDPRVTPEQARKGLEVLAGLATEILRAGRTDGLYLFLSGGDTAEAFLRVSGGEAIELRHEVLPGLVLGCLLGGMADGLPVITKAGAFGGEQTLVALYERLSTGAAS